MKNKRGISLIVLMITIIVMTVLAGTIILTLNNSGIIGKSSEAVFKQNVKNYQSELSLYFGEQLALNSKFNIATINASNTTTPNIKEIISSMSDEDVTKFEVLYGKLRYIGTNREENLWAKEVGLEANQIPLTEEEYNEKYATEIANALKYGSLSEDGTYTITKGFENSPDIALPYGTKKIDLFTFSWTRLGKLIIPSTTETIVSNGDYMVGYIVVEYGNPNYTSKNGMLFNANGTILIAVKLPSQSLVVVPEGTVSMAYRAFETCETYNSVVLPSTLVSASVGFGECMINNLYIESTKLDGVTNEGMEKNVFNGTIYVRSAEVADRLKALEAEQEMIEFGYDPIVISTDYNWVAPTE